MKPLFKVVSLLSSLICLASSKTFLESPGLFYECTQDNTISITANKTTEYGSIYAVTNGTKNNYCNVTRNDGSNTTTFTISACNVTSSIKVIVMKENQTADEMMVIGGEGLHVYNLKCSDIRKGGTNVTKTFEVYEGKEPAGEERHQKLANLSMKITRENDTSNPVSSAVLVGEKLSILISTNNGYKFMARSCIAKDAKDATHTRNLIHDGLTYDTHLITNFSHMTNSSDHSNRTVIKATLYAFHFRGSDNISIECTVTVCEADDTSCNITNEHIIKRRAVSREPYSETLQSTLRVLDSKRNDDGFETSGTSDDSKPWLYSVILCTFAAIVKMWI